MTLPSLLRHVGVHVPRGVTVSGRVITGSHASGLTQVEPHIFHGGSGDMESTLTAPLAHWWTDPEALAADVAHMAEVFPQFLVAPTEDLRYVGTLDTGRGRFEIALEARSLGRVPRIVPVRPHSLGRRSGRGFTRAPHLFDNGDLCVATDEDWIASSRRSATAVAWAAHWLAAYTDWRIGGPWPTTGFQPHAR